MKVQNVFYLSFLLFQCCFSLFLYSLQVSQLFNLHVMYYMDFYEKIASALPFRSTLCVIGYSQSLVVDGVTCWFICLGSGKETKQFYSHGVALDLKNCDRLKLALKSDLGHIFLSVIKHTGLSSLLIRFFPFLFQSLRTSKGNKKTDIAHSSKIKIKQ